jgi:hypothetical protein
MKRILTLFLLAALYSPAVIAQVTAGEDVGSGVSVKANPKARLQMTARVIEKKHHCANFVGFTVQLTFKNVGERPVLLDKRSLVARLTVSRDLEAVTAKRHEIDRHHDSFGLGEYFSVDPSDMSNFVTLKPGEDYSLETGVGSLWVAEGAPPPKGYLIAGTHYLQLKIVTWTYFADPAPFSSKWSDHGFLWTEGLVSQPVAFTVEVDKRSPECRQ